MGSPQFLFLLEAIHKTGATRRLAWQPVRLPYSQQCAFALALGEGVIKLRVTDNREDETWQSRYNASLTTRDGALIDEIDFHQFESERFELMRDLFHQARNAAFYLFCGL